MSKPKDAPSLVQFVRAKKREGCLVCTLPPEIREQVGRPASEKKINRDLQVAWLQLVSGVKITADQLNNHINGRHDGAA